MTPEQAHHSTITMLSLAGAVPPASAILKAIFKSNHPATPVEAFGITFPNCIGMAAGYDKDGTGWRGLATLGFGDIERGLYSLKVSHLSYQYDVGVLP